MRNLAFLERRKATEGLKIGLFVAVFSRRLPPFGAQTAILSDHVAHSDRLRLPILTGLRQGSRPFTLPIVSTYASKNAHAQLLIMRIQEGILLANQAK